MKNSVWAPDHICFLLLDTAALTEYVLLHVACIQLEHTTLSWYYKSNFDPLAHISAMQRIVGRNGQKSMLACILQHANRCTRTNEFFGILDLTYWHMLNLFLDCIAVKVLGRRVNEPPSVSVQIVCSELADFEVYLHYEPQVHHIVLLCLNKLLQYIPVKMKKRGRLVLVKLPHLLCTLHKYC